MANGWYGKYDGNYYRLEGSLSMRDATKKALEGVEGAVKLMAVAGRPPTVTGSKYVLRSG